MIKINEIFYSVQGEGPNTGKPSVFVRLTGCNLVCPYCDTKYALKKGEEFDNDFIANKIFYLLKSNNCDQLVITGGEPFSKENIEQTHFLANYFSKNFKISVETNLFSRAINNVENFIKTIHNCFNYIICSPKLEPSCFPFAIGVDKIIKYYTTFPNILNLYYKIVYYPEIEKTITSLIDKLFPLFNRDHIFIMPYTSIDFSKWNESCVLTVEFCKKHNLQYSPRLHIDLWGLKRGV